MPTLEIATGHRERKKQATRRAIHLAAVDLVDQYGLSGATIEAISERAGVAPRTFWSYYASKEEAVLFHDPERPEALRLALLARPASEDALTAIWAVLDDDLSRRFIDRDESLRRGRLIRGNPQLMAAVAANFDEIERALVSAVAERCGQNPDRDIYPGIVVSAACGACRVAQMRWSAEPRRRSLRSVLDEAFNQLSAGLEAPLGEQRGKR